METKKEAVWFIYNKYLEAVKVNVSDILFIYCVTMCSGQECLYPEGVMAVDCRISHPESSNMLVGHDYVFQCFL